MKHISRLLVFALTALLLGVCALADPEPFGDIDAVVTDTQTRPAAGYLNPPAGDRSAGQRMVVSGKLSDGVDYVLYADGLLHLYGMNISAHLKEEVNLRSYFSTIKNIHFGSGVQKIGRYAISDIPSLETVTFSDGVCEIGEHAFSGCASLAELNGEEHLQSIGMYAFSGCSALKNISLSSIQQIGQYAFYNCSLIQTVTIGDRLTDMQLRVFEGCTSLNSVAISSSVPEYAFFGLSSIRSVSVNSPATVIGESAFSSCSALNSVLIDESVCSIGNSAFEKCTSITNLVLPEYLGMIGDYAFYECVGLRMLSMPQTLDEIGDSAFDGCSSLTDVEVFANRIGKRVFSGCTNLRNVSFSNPMCLIGTDVLSGCRLDTLDVASENIPVRAFRNLDVLTVTLKPTVRSIGESAFENSTVRNLVIPSGVNRIDNYAFRACQNLESIRDEDGKDISVPASVMNLGKWIFYDCKSLQKLTIACPDIPEEAFRGITSLESFVITDTVLSIGRRAFMDCTQLSQVDLGKNGRVQTIGDEAFAGCTGVSRVRIPVSVRRVGKNVFLNCDGSLGTIVYCGTHADWNKVTVEKDIKKWTGVNSYIKWCLNNSDEYKKWE